jgi:hypothetical protein
LSRFLVRDKPIHWDLVFKGNEFSYNNLINRYMRRNIFQIVYGRSLKGVTNLVWLLKENLRSAGIESFVELMKEAHE